MYSTDSILALPSFLIFFLTLELQIPPPSVHYTPRGENSSWRHAQNLQESMKGPTQSPETEQVLRQES